MAGNPSDWLTVARHVARWLRLDDIAVAIAVGAPVISAGRYFDYSRRSFDVMDAGVGPLLANASIFCAAYIFAAVMRGCRARSRARKYKANRARRNADKQRDAEAAALQEVKLLKEVVDDFDDDEKVVARVMLEIGSPECWGGRIVDARIVIANAAGAAVAGAALERLARETLLAVRRLEARGIVEYTDLSEAWHAAFDTRIHETLSAHPEWVGSQMKAKKHFQKPLKPAAPDWRRGRRI